MVLEVVVLLFQILLKQCLIGTQRMGCYVESMLLQIPREIRIQEAWQALLKQNFLKVRKGILIQIHSEHISLVRDSVGSQGRFLLHLENRCLHGWKEHWNKFGSFMQKLFMSSRDINVIPLGLPFLPARINLHFYQAKTVYGFPVKHHRIGSIVTSQTDVLLEWLSSRPQPTGRVCLVICFHWQFTGAHTCQVICVLYFFFGFGLRQGFSAQLCLSCNSLCRPS